MLVMIITNEQQKDKNLIALALISSLLSRFVLAMLIPQMIPKHIPTIKIVAKYVPVTLKNLLIDVTFRFSQYTSDGSGALSYLNPDPSLLSPQHINSFLIAWRMA